MFALPVWGVYWWSSLYINQLSWNKQSLGDTSPCSLCTITRSWRFTCGCSLDGSAKTNYLWPGTFAWYKLHNDLKGDNIVLTSTNLTHYSIKAVIIDFGKACETSKGRIYKLSESQKEQYKLHRDANYIASKWVRCVVRMSEIVSCIAVDFSIASGNSSCCLVLNLVL